MFNKLLLLLIFNFSLYVQAQQKYWVLFKDKPLKDYNPYSQLSKECINNRLILGIDIIQESDVPVNKLYVEKCVQLGIKIKHVSKWINGFSTVLNDKEFQILNSQAFVKEIIKIKPNLYLAKENKLIKRKQYGTALSMMEFDIFRNQGLKGENITIGVIDAGFYNLNIVKYAKHIYSKSRILGYKDFLDPEHEENFYNNLTGGDSHGREVVKLIAGKNKSEIFGFAPEAKFYLARTEHAKKEMRIEEDSWVKAIEWMDSLGVRLVNTSLGYSKGFDNPEENYSKEDMNGETTVVAKCAKIATEQKGMLIVVSAGNEGNESNWRIISSPADVEGVLSVGATIYDRSKAGYSSIGPEFINFLKPNLSAPALNGTSYSAPLVTGFVACIMQLKPTLKSSEIKNIIEKSAHLYPYGNNFVGFGIPKASNVMSLIENSSISNKKYIITSDSLAIIDSIDFEPNNLSIKEGRLAENNKALTQRSKIIVYHKKNKFHVDTMEIINNDLPKIIIQRKKGTKYCTIDLDKRVVEIEWIED